MFKPIIQAMHSRVRRFSRVFTRGRDEREMQAEMEAHLAFEIDDRVRKGMTPQEARQSALALFGGVERFKEEARDVRGVRPFIDLQSDMRYAWRVLTKSPIFSITTCITVAIGVAGVAAVFSIVNATLLRPPPVHAPQRLFALAERWKGGGRSMRTDLAQHMYRIEHIREVRNASRDVFSDFTAYRHGSVALRSSSGTRGIGSMGVAPNYFQTLGVTPALGRFFFVERSRDLEAYNAAEIVISYALWQGEFNGDSSVVGRVVYVDSKPVQIVGVAREYLGSLITGIRIDVWLPVSDGQLVMLARLRDGISREAAQDRLRLIAPAIESEMRNRPMTGIDLESLVGPPAMARSAMFGFLAMLLLCAVMVLAIVATNVAGMFLARGAARRREIAVRLSLGATRARVIRQLLTESVLLCSIGGALGVLLARWMMTLMPAIDLPTGQTALLDLSMDAPVMAVALVVVALTGVLTGVSPAFVNTRFDIAASLRAVAGHVSPKGARLRGIFVGAQLTLSLVLMSLAGLFIRALDRANHVELGFDTKNVATAEINLYPHGYSNAGSEQTFDRLVQMLQQDSRITNASLAQWAPLAFNHNSDTVILPSGNGESYSWGIADTAYASTMHVPVVQGRWFNSSDRADATRVIVINETLARRMFPNESPIGRTIDVGGPSTVVGVAKDGKYRGLDDGHISYMFWPYRQRPSKRMVLFVRGRTSADEAIAAMRDVLGQINPNVALEKVAPLEDQLALYKFPQLLASWCIGVFALFGLFLGAIGMYGLMAFTVVQRSREIGIRMALGALPSSLMSRELAKSARLLGIAIVVGVPLAFAAGRVLKSFLYGLGPADPLVMAGVIALLCVVSIIACLVPARRIAATDPVRALRAE